MRLRPALASDATALAAVHALTFEAPWSAHEIASLMAAPGGFALKVDAADGLAGFILCRAVADEAEILTLATSPAHRRQGVARALVEAAAAAARGVGAQAMFLEVAADNAPALGLYQGAGFVRAGLRKAYYARGAASAADALVLRRELSS
ncbi:MAG TPA: GNAT family N-acetyltransferase [Caulobacteraceae bacterium]|nr:GNAT family N-acetyltransferase [Caulobacteraceae bacterium]